MLINSSLFSSDIFEANVGYGKTYSKYNSLDKLNPYSIGLKTNILGYYLKDADFVINARLNGSFAKSLNSFNYGLGLGYVLNRVQAELFTEKSNITLHGDNKETISYGLDVEYDMFAKDTGIHRSIFDGRKYFTFLKAGLCAELSSREIDIHGSRKRYFSLGAYLYFRLGYK